MYDRTTGLPEADDYDPEALGTVETRAGSPEQEWPEFGLEMVPIEYKSVQHGDWLDTGRRLIVRNGDYIADVSEDYKLLPNERLIGVANNVARDLGAIPFNEWERTGERNDGWYVKLDDHVYQDPRRTRVHGLYAWQSGTVGEDEMEYGFAVHNSIDGSLGFSVGLFTFRHACANMVHLGTGSSREARGLGVESERQILNRHTQQHTAGLAVDEEALTRTIKGTLTLIEDVDSTYEAWLHEQVTPEDVRDLLKRPQLAKGDLPEWMQAMPEIIEEERQDRDEYDEDEPMPWEDQAEIIEARMPGTTDKWTTYNRITEAIWHEGDAGDTTRRGKMKDVHRVFNPTEHGEHGVALR